MMYSLDSFLFERLNEGSRNKDTSVIKTLGPYAVALSKVINHTQSKRKDQIKGKFICYSGIKLTKDVIN